MSGSWQLDIDPADFLRHHWQKAPLLIKGALPGFVPPLDAGELAGLAMEPDIESRIIERAADRWRLQHGPFREQDFQRRHPWTLLVQSVDRHLPEVAALRDLVRFIPDWRLDDIMVSYASDGGSVGPHYDNYDVFLLQGEGQRLWQLGQPCDDASALLPHDELRILADFEATEEYLLRTGDMLYLPPRIAHWGLARGDCTTFSIGFRAPATRDLVARWVDHRLDGIDAEAFYTDPQLEPVRRPGEISNEDIARVQQLVHEALADASDDDWFGELVSEPAADETAWINADGPGPTLEDCAALQLNPAGRVFWREARDAVVYSNGESLVVDASVLPCLIELCSSGRLDGAILRQPAFAAGGRQLFEFLVRTGGVYVQ